MGWSHQEEATEHKRVYITLVTPWYSLRVAEEIVEWGEMGGGGVLASQSWISSGPEQTMRIDFTLINAASMTDTFLCGVL